MELGCFTSAKCIAESERERKEVEKSREGAREEEAVKKKAKKQVRKAEDNMAKNERIELRRNQCRPPILRQRKCKIMLESAAEDTMATADPGTSISLSYSFEFVSIK